MGTSVNWEKKYKEWYEHKFVPACAAYAVSYMGYSHTAGLDTMEEYLIKLEAQFKIPEPAITKYKKSGPPPADAATNSLSAPKQELQPYSAAVFAFRAAAGTYGEANSVEKAFETAADFALPLALDKGDPTTNPALFYNLYHYYLTAAAFTPYSAGGSSAPYEAGFDLLKPVLRTLLDPEIGLNGFWAIAQKYNFWNIKGAPNSTLFNVLISTILTAGFSGDDLNKFFDILHDVGVSATHPRVPVTYMAPWAMGDSTNPGAWSTDSYNDLETRAKEMSDTDLKSKFVFRQRYLVAEDPVVEHYDPKRMGYLSPLVKGNSRFLGGLTQGPRPLTAAEYGNAWTPYYPWKLHYKGFKTKIEVSKPSTETAQELGRLVGITAGVGVHGRIKQFNNADARAFVKKNRDTLINKHSQGVGGKLEDAIIDMVEAVYGIAPKALHYAFRQMILDIGRNSTVKAKGGQGYTYYEQIMYDILWGLQVPEPPKPSASVAPTPSTGGGGSSQDKRLPRNVDKRPLKKGEVHAINLQCYLLENITKLAAIKEQVNYKKLGKISEKMPGNIVSKINHGSPSATEPKEDSTNPLWPPEEGGPDSEAYWLQNMCPDIWGLMTPHIELYRVDYDRLNKGNLVPTGEKRIPFKNFVDKSDIREITAGSYGRIGGAGIKSFSWSLDGVQPAEVDNMISAKLVLHFQSVYDLFRYNKIHPDDPESDEYSAGILDHAGYLDLIIGSGTTVNRGEDAELETKTGQEANLCLNAREKYEGARYRIKAIVGWATPPNFKDLKIPGYSSSTLESIGKAITASRRALYLQIVSHAISFQQDGTLELSIDYQASISGIMRSPDADIFIAPDINKEAREALELKREKLPCEDSAKRATMSKEEIDKCEEKKQTALEKEVELMRQSRMNKYSVFLDSLQEKNKIYGIRVPSKRLLKPLRDMDPDERAAEAKVRALEPIVPVQASEAEKAGEKTSKELSGDKDSVVESFEATTGDDPTAVAKLKQLSDEVGIFNTGNQEDVLVPYFYLGDLIDVLFEMRLAHLVEKVGEENATVSALQMLLGTVELIDPLQAFQIKEVVIDCPNASEETKAITKRLSEVDPLRFRRITGISTFMNIGSIPISLEKFNEWFLNNVMRLQKDSYFLLNFIKDICADLIGEAYSDLCFKNAFQFNIRFDTATFRLADNFAGAPGITVDALGRSARDARKMDVLQLRDAGGPGGAPPSIPTVLIYSVDSRPSVGDRASDMSEGIYHYFLGGRCGLAKEIVFNRQDMPFYREARISKDGSLGAQQLKELYTISMNMVGNNLHKNGTYVYIDPIAIGAGSSRAIGGIPNIARLIGLGGYFLVTAVKHEVSDSGFNTTVDAMQEMSAFNIGDDEALTPILFSGAPKESEPNVAPPGAGAAVSSAAAAGAAAGAAAAAADPAGSTTGDQAGLVVKENEEVEVEEEELTDKQRRVPPAAAAETPAEPDEEGTVTMTFGHQAEADSAQQADTRRRLAALEERGYDNLSPGEQLMYSKYQEQLKEG